MQAALGRGAWVCEYLANHGYYLTIKWLNMSHDNKAFVQSIV
jgi:hypothetical protein